MPQVRNDFRRNGREAGLTAKSWASATAFSVATSRNVAKNLQYWPWGSKALLAGSISRLGSQYMVGLQAVNCGNGDTLAKEQGEASSKEEVVKALGKVASSVRTRLGESLASVQKFNVPIEATTSSLEALKTFSMGVTTQREKGDAEAIPFIRRAIELDPNFAVAYAILGVSYANLGQPSLSAENLRKAYELRDRVSEKERLRISAYYYGLVAEELEM